MKAALFAVVSPLQYINALEAVEAFGLKPEQCYLAIGESKKLEATTRQLRSLIDPALWRAIQGVSGVPAPKAKNLLHAEWRFFLGARQYAAQANRLIAEARKDWGAIDYVFLGDYRPLNFRHFLGAIPEAQHWLLDDGSVTHQVARFRRDPKSPHLFSKPFAQNGARTRRRSFLSGLKFAEPETLGFFSCYDVDVPVRDSLRQHSYASFRRRFSNLAPLDEIWFLGANHPENQFTSMDRYLSLLRRVREFYRGQHVAYLPHRGESEAKLEQVRAMGFALRNFDLPVEIAIGKTGKYPRIIAGIASSAIDNLSVILGRALEVHLFCVGEGYAEKERWKHLRDVIAYHQRDVFGLTLQLAEDDVGHFRGRARDHRYALRDCTEDGGSERFGGYSVQATGLLGGSWECELATRVLGGDVGVRLLRPLAVRPWRLGEQVVIRLREITEAVRAEVVEVLLCGDLVLAPVRPFEVPGPTRGTIERLSPRREFAKHGRAMGLLLEPGSENLLRHTRDFARGAWQLTGLAPWGNGSASLSRIVPGPDGELGAAFLKLDRSLGEHSFAQQVMGGTEASPLTFSIFLRSGGCAQVKLLVRHPASGALAQAEFHLQEAEDGPTSASKAAAVVAGTAAQRQLPEQWHRCSVSAVMPPGEVIGKVEMALGDSYQFQGDGCSALYLWGPQLERQPFATSYLPTSGGGDSRDAETVSLELPNEDGSLLIEVSLPQCGTAVSVLQFADLSRLEVDFAHGVQRLVAGLEVITAPISRVATDQAFVIGVQRRLGRVSVSIEGSAPLWGRAGLASGDWVSVQGGPVHLRRSIHCESASNDAEFAALCTSESMARLDRPEELEAS